jgi:hypothetical protein
MADGHSVGVAFLRLLAQNESEMNCSPYIVHVNSNSSGATLKLETVAAFSIILVQLGSIDSQAKSTQDCRLLLWQALAPGRQSQLSTTCMLFPGMVALFISA